jgi:dihydrofolate reductase
MIKLILACDLNGVIGNENELPWGKSLPYDLNRFKELTEGHIVVMGRKTFDSIGGKPLPNRENVVLSRKSLVDDHTKNLYHSNDIGAILDQYDYTGGDRDLWIIGGMNVYKQFMPYVQEIYITEVQGVFEGDTGLDIEFSKCLNDDFNPESLYEKRSDEKNKYAMNFLKFTRIKGEYK